MAKKKTASDSSLVDIFDFIAKPAGLPQRGICALVGNEPFLVSEARSAIAHTLGSENDDPIRVFDPDQQTVNWSDVNDEINTRSLFGGDGPRIAIVQDADSFVTANRDRLESLAQSTSIQGLLVLCVTKWPANTKLAKLVAEHGIAIDCRLPTIKRGSNSYPDEQKISKWILRRAKHHGIQLDSDAALLLQQITEHSFGLMEQELRKLALYIEADQSVSVEDVQSIVGGWAKQTSWQVVDLAAEGRAGEALTELDRLLQSGEHPAALFGSISWSLRRYATATRVFIDAEQRGSRPSLEKSLTAAGFYGNQIKNAVPHLKQMGRDRAGQLYKWLLQTDLDLKNQFSSPARWHLPLESLILRLARQPKTR
ncbi:MAG TPA: DNA polymerase III subunit delta [Planctomycetaceae bacterium]|jgi:DNA polymerase-3 subunit delta|nr:DNA polymerase III subunit delta [Rhodopirellula sp.]HCK71989.1 DNA polymerase III subunit delta [Planctomycetaceae bacterium]HCP85230.1 DNA polymerase III subunit delta [Planctomycetaceae bacterium]|tara:strand:- start:1402 stop:2505 length:1104 start_codon:yes stop_codon:yes gene_type:complete